LPDKQHPLCLQSYPVPLNPVNSPVLVKGVATICPSQTAAWLRRWSRTSLWPDVSGDSLGTFYGRPLYNTHRDETGSFYDSLRRTATAVPREHDV